MNESGLPIVEVTTQRRHLPFVAPLTTGAGPISGRDVLLVGVEDAEGRQGWGEAAPLPGWEVGELDEIESWVRQVGAEMVGRPPVPSVLWGDPAGDYPPPGPGAAVSALGTALFDLAARQQEMPMAELLARQAGFVTSPVAQSSVAVNALIGGGPVEKTVAAARAAVAAGFRTLKCKVGIGPVAEDAARILAVADATGRADAPGVEGSSETPAVAIRVDANGAWSAVEARQFVRALDGLALEWIEDPVPPSELEAVGPTLGYPVASEWRGLESWRLADAGALSTVVTKLPTTGGPYPLRLIAETAARKGVDVVVTSFLGSSIGIHAALHTAAALGPDLPACGLATADLLAQDLAPAPEIVDGHMLVPTTPGLGITPHPI